MSNTFNNEWFTEGNSGMYLDQEEAKIIYDVGGAGGAICATRSGLEVPA